MNYRRLRRLIIGLLAIVLLAGQMQFTYVFAEGKDETISANATEDGEVGTETDIRSESEAAEEPQMDEAVPAVQALMDALPTVEAVKAMDMEGQHTAYEQTQAAYDAYMVLSEEQRTLILGVEKIDALFGYFNEQTAALATDDFTVTGGTEGTDYTYADGVLTILTATPITIKNTDLAVATTDHIEVEDGVNANITLAGINIDVSSNRNTAAFKIADDSTGKVTITLADGTDNILKSGNNCAGLQKNGDTSSGTLTIKGNTGTLTATGESYGAGIGGGASGNGSNITISGGSVIATGGTFAAGIGGAGNYGKGSNITINGGSVTAIGGQGGAGIGGGATGNGSNITISGGSVTATGGVEGAGIGGGTTGDGSDIAISGGSVTATGALFGAGIGGGSLGNGSNITISGGSVTATGGECGAGIGGGANRGGSNITISGGSVMATGGETGAGIGGGEYGNGSNITIENACVTTTGGDYGAGIGGGYFENGSNITIENACVAATGGVDADAIGAGRSGDSSGININKNNSLVIENGEDTTVTGNVTVNGDFIISGGVTVTIEERASLTVGENTTLTNNGTIIIDVGGTLTGKGTVINNGVIIDNNIPEAVIDYVKENLTGLENNTDYIISLGDSQNGEKVTSDGNGNIAVSSNWFGKEISIAKTREYNVLSASQKLTIPERPEAPANLTSTEESHPNAADGTITGVAAGYAYQVSDDGGLTWQDATLSGATLTGLSGGTYLVRIKAVSGVRFHSNASDPVTIGTIPPVPYEKPEAEIDHENGNLTGLEPGGTYEIDGKEVTADENGNIHIEDEWAGKTVDIVRVGDGGARDDSEPQEVTIPAKETAPKEAKGSDVSAPDKADGKITGLIPGEEYSISSDGGNTWKDVTANERGEITGLSQGEYLLRKKAKDGTISSDSVSCTIGVVNAEASGNTSTAPGTAPKTGDDSNLALWGMLFILSGVGLCRTITVWMRRKRMN